MIRNGLEPWHLLILLAIVLLMFGSTKLPELARGVGRSIRIFKSEVNELRSETAEPEPAQIETGGDEAHRAAAPAEQVHHDK